MSKWLNAIGQGVAAVAKVGSDAIDTQVKQEAAIAAEQRAADLKLATAERMLAIEDAMKTRAGDRFAAIYQQKAGEEVPLEAPSVDQTGITHEGGAAAGLTTGGIAASKDDMTELEQRARDTLRSPGATDEQKADAKALLAQLGKQVEAQKTVNEKSVEGKTRTRGDTEAARAAMAEAAGSDFGAFTAGSSAWKDAFAREETEKVHAITAADKDADRSSREKVAKLGAETRREIAVEQVDARRDIAGAETARKTAADQARAEATKARAEALAGGKGDKATALMKNYDFFAAKLGKDEAERILFTAKDSSDAEKAFKIMLADKFGDVKPADAAAKVQEVKAAAKAAAPTAKAAAPAVKALPAGAKQIGTYKGKPVFQTPAGKKFVQE